jgi:ubiquinone/menaquinone biosynthesis C-methylase UbiE
LDEQKSAQAEVQQQAGKILSHVAGYVGTRTIDIGLKRGILAEIGRNGGGITHRALAQKLGMDPLYIEVWCRSAYAAEVLDLTADGAYKLAPHMDKLLLDHDFPGYVAGPTGVLLEPEVFDTFAENLESGERLWWDKCGPGFISAVMNTGRAFYNRLVPTGLSRIDGLDGRLDKGVHVLELGCGLGFGLAKMADHYPNSTFVGIDGDVYSLGLASDAVEKAGVGNRVSLVESALEDIVHDAEFDAAIINITMHECRDAEKVTENVHRALRPDGHFVISDMPFPEKTEEMRTVPARIMGGIQFFEALIDDQLLPTKSYMEMLENQGFRNVAAFEMTPVHSVIHGQK